MKIEAGDRIRGAMTGSLHRINEHLGYDTSTQEKHFADQFQPLVGLSQQFLDHGITPNEMTLFGGVARATGSLMMGRPQHVRGFLEEKTGKRIPLPVIAVSGFALWTGGILADGLDGEMAKLSGEAGVGETKMGRVMDGGVDAVAVNALTLAIEHKPDSGSERVGWKLFDDASLASTLIRSSANGAGLSIGKADTGSQMGVEAITLASHVVELVQKKRAEGHLGAILSWVRARDAVLRYKVVLESGDTNAIKQVTRDVTELFVLGVLGARVSESPYPSFLLRMAKVCDVMYGEVNQNKRPSNIIFDSVHQSISDFRNRS